MSERDKIVRALAALAGAIDLLEKGGKEAVASDKMFEQILVDYRNALDEAREQIGECEYCGGTEDCSASNGLFLCTRDADHKGDHVACGGESMHVLACWPRK